jgi:hypothetical protein
MEHKPVYNGVACFGEDLSNEHRLRQLELKWLIMRVQQTKRSSSILLQNWPEHENSNNKLKTESEADIRESWETGLEKFKMRAKYLIY